MEKQKVFLLTLAVIAITTICTIALLKGVDGVVVGIGIVIIGLLAPSPIFQIKWKDIITVAKGNANKGENSNER